MKTPPIIHSWWVADNLLAGPYPGHPDKIEAERNYAALVAEGVSVMVNLQEPDETGMSGTRFPDYRPSISRLTAEKGTEAVFHRYPIRDMGVTTVARVGEILDQIDAAHSDGRCVYVHCWGGHGRTGTIVGCWLVRHGMTADQALKRMAILREHDDYLAQMASPQTRAQANVIRNWVARAEG